MTQRLMAGDVGRFNTAASVATTDTISVYQSGVLRNATPAQLSAAQASASGILQTQVANVTLTSAQILALNATPITVIATPGAGFVNIVTAVYATKAAGTAYAGIAAGEDIALRYTDGSGSIGATLEMTGFADSTALTQAYGSSAASPLPVANAVIVAHMTTGEITTGNSDFKLTIYYRTYPTPAF